MILASDSRIFFKFSTSSSLNIKMVCKSFSYLISGIDKSVWIYYLNINEIIPNRILLYEEYEKKTVTVGAH